METDGGPGPGLWDGQWALRAGLWDGQWALRAGLWDGQWALRAGLWDGQWGPGPGLWIEKGVCSRSRPGAGLGGFFEP